MTDPVTGWIETKAVPSACTDIVANQVELAWLTCCLLPTKVILDRGNEFLAEFKPMMENNYRTELG